MRFAHTLKDLPNLMSSAMRLSISCLTKACLFFKSLSFSLDTNSRKAASAAGYTTAQKEDQHETFRKISEMKAGKEQASIKLQRPKRKKKHSIEEIAMTKKK